MAGRFLDLLGTIYNKIQLGLGGPQIKNNSGVIEGRNAADNAYVAIAAALFKAYGDDFELNSGASETGDDWKFTLSRPSTGMTHNLQVIFPADDPSNGQVLVVEDFTGDVITLGYANIAAGDEKVVCEKTTIAYSDSSPAPMFTLPATGEASLVRVTIRTPWNGSAQQLSVGISGTPSKYLPTTAVDLTAAAKTSFDYVPGEEAPGSPENWIITHTNTGASAGEADVYVFYTPDPS
jgi:hypothetical protein